MSVDHEFHPYANIFPFMTQDESSKHIADIKERGLDEAIVLYQGMILDGRNRYRSCAAAHVEPRFVEFDGDDAGAMALVIAKNLHRRHLTSSQSSMCSLEAEKHYGEIAKKRKQELSGTRSNPGSDVTQTIGEPAGRHKGEAAHQAAEMFGTNRQYVADAKKIAEQSPETAEQVKQGKVTIPQAKKKLGIGKPKKPKGQSRVNGVVQDDPPEIAKKRAKGLIADGVVPEITTVNEGGETVEGVTDERDERAAIQADTSDEAWLASLPLSSHLGGYPLNLFHDDALFYRHIEPSRKAFGKKVAELLNKSRRKGAYGNRIQLALSCSSPKDWKACPALDVGGCGGTGQVKTIGQCSKCFGRGYLIF